MTQFGTEVHAQARSDSQMHENLAHPCTNDLDEAVLCSGVPRVSRARGQVSLGTPPSPFMAA